MPISARQWDEIRALEERAREISLEQGEPYHVDHIIPIKGRVVTGLHWPSNMRIIRGGENQRKSSSLPPEHDWVDYSASAWKPSNS
ncbi:hypothetical protein TSH7_02780 [Azospirillum sp. TSH7]|nr:hypothetical protein TSH20_13440 [Azospirillum sp. TSH20]PWC68159.1 hypothetical protein TSH7_02780 [Azospirillum sp. TSH7]